MKVGGKVAGTATVDWSDPLWTDVAGTAAYVRRMAVRRWATGPGAVILDWVADTAGQRGVDAIGERAVAALKTWRILTKPRA
ncbi:hypothetical protein AB0B45_24000 [Nonomuraea sp. NPDC049152]|uniref:hypothetical protein n=1 Tax=Nonomuraea sp. NPDC049152 TaxID=3154350 RepID=UPI0033D34DE3